MADRIYQIDSNFWWGRNFVIKMADMRIIWAYPLFCAELISPCEDFCFKQGDFFVPGGVEGSSDRESSIGIAEWIPNFL